MNWKDIHHIAQWGRKWKMSCGLKLNPQDDDKDEPCCTILPSVTTCKNCLRVIDAKRYNTKSN